MKSEIRFVRIPEDSPSSGERRRWGNAFGCLLAALLLAGCASNPLRECSATRPFDFQRDTFAFANGLTWEYGYDAQGKWTSHRRAPPPHYTLHCFVVARSAAQFFVNARFDPGQPPADEATYRRLIRQVVSTRLRRPLPDSEKIVIPGYADLRSFSRAREALLQAECGSATQGYFQRGNWRMVMPFTRHEQARMSQQLLEDLKGRHPLVIHAVCFPSLTINHALLIFSARETDQEILFEIYDPNDPDKPSTLAYNRARRTFLLPASAYFPGGPVNVYEVYRSLLY